MPMAGLHTMIATTNMAMADQNNLSALPMTTTNRHIGTDILSGVVAMGQVRVTDIDEEVSRNTPGLMAIETMARPAMATVTTTANSRRTAATVAYMATKATMATTSAALAPIIMEWESADGSERAHMAIITPTAPAGSALSSPLLKQCSRATAKRPSKK